MTTTTRHTLSRRGFLGLAGAGAVGAGLAMAGCAPSSGGSAAGSSGSDSGGDTTGGDFTFASWSLSEEAAEPTVQGLIDTYSTASGGVVTGVSYPYNDYLNQLLLQVRGGEFTGAAQLDIAWLATLASLGKLRDLGEVAEGRGYTDTALASGQVDGTQYGLPWATGAVGPIANQAFLDQAGVTEHPATIADFEAALREIKKLGNGIIPYAAMTKAAQLKDIFIWMETFGSPLVEGEKTTIGDDASVEAVAWYKRLYDEGLIAADIDRFDARALFSQGRVAVYDDAIASKSKVVADATDPSLVDTITPMTRPVLNAGDTPRSLLWGYVVTVVDGEGADPAADFAQWLTSDPEASARYFDELFLPPTTEEALASDAVQGDEFTTLFTERITATATPSPFWRFPQYIQMESVVAEQVQAVLVGTASPTDAMKTAGDAVQALM